MFKYKNQTDNPEVRIAGYKFAKDYENALKDMFGERTQRAGISSLKLDHNNTVFSLAPDRKTDFSGKVQVPQEVINALSTTYIQKDTCRIDGKSGRIDSYNGPCDKNFARYFADKVNSGGFGSLHNAEYVLFVDKNSGSVICVNAINPVIN